MKSSCLFYDFIVKRYHLETIYFLAASVYKTMCTHYTIYKEVKDTHNPLLAKTYNLIVSMA